jgi:hypothetical protein
MNLEKPGVFRADYTSHKNPGRGVVLILSSRKGDISQAVFRSLRNNSTWPCICLSVKLLAQLAQSQKFSIVLFFALAFFV